MDYTQENLPFKMKKALRYIQLFGVSRTFQKIRSQYHMKKTYDVLPEERGPTDTKHVAIIGCGNFAFSTIAYYLTKNYGNVIRACCDVNIHRAASLFEAYKLDYYSEDASRILSDDQIDVIYIASNHASHAEYAIEALKRDKDVHIEKPHVVNEDQLNRLVKAIETSQGKVSLGFNRPHSKLGRLIKQHLDSQQGAGVYNWFVAGHAIDPDHWYFHDAEGGRILGNLCHWTDFVFHMVPEDQRFPITIIPTRDRRSDCDIAASYIFGDGSIAAITFSAKGHTFEGVRERFSAHKGNALVSMDDFSDLTIEIADKKNRWKSRHRDHGHEQSIKYSYEMSHGNNDGRSIDYIWNSAQLFLKTKEAMESNKKIVIHEFEQG